MIQIRRGKTANWRKPSKPLAAGQPGYDKDKHKIKIGDGLTPWSLLPYASGLGSEDILMPEAEAKIRNLLDPEDSTLITYGTEFPSKDTTGQVYLQYYETDPETDYIVESGVNGMWSYQKWNSGVAKCFGTLNINAKIDTAFDGNILYHDSNSMKAVAYPFTFKKIPTEIVTLQSPGGITWVASKASNSKTQSGIYSLISPDKKSNNTTYKLSVEVSGFWR